MNWNSVIQIPTKSYICGYCSNKVASKDGWYASEGSQQYAAFAVICPQCNKCTYIEEIGDVVQTPTPIMGNPVSHLSEEVEALYEEARACTSVNAHMSSVMSCRTLLMYMAVDLDAEVGLRFIDYIDFLEQEGHIPSKGRDWVNYIREVGNKANHEIKSVSPDDSEKVLLFTETLVESYMNSQQK